MSSVQLSLHVWGCVRAAARGNGGGPRRAAMWAAQSPNHAIVCSVGEYKSIMLVLVWQLQMSTSEPNDSNSCFRLLGSLSWPSMVFKYGEFRTASPCLTYATEKPIGS